MRRLSDKTAEVTSLRDGLFNATSLREASRATTMNRYVIIFTIVTVLYLPPSFISTVFGMTIFQKDVDQTTREYKITTVVVSLITYLVALISIIAVNWDHLKRKFHLWWNTPQTKVPVEDNSTSKPQVPPVGPTPESPAPRPEDNENKAEASKEQVDVESGVNEVTGEGSKPKSSWARKIWR
ncbi:hypothetical protein L207DRAFT_42246 [Hyaloscypha variabilis F]|uniref:Uncharacterized protein n=1 Tax=Hyaloscypha variabilis (strain UAMH 11265 / GT02V1 / F) TaxID=1149755 RepID=A0A2J6RJI4_HYAVF|nr:hypothetical protein L207DRAFT_42246 [Hyaloscypha variabilis F]